MTRQAAFTDLVHAVDVVGESRRVRVSRCGGLTAFPRCESRAPRRQSKATTRRTPSSPKRPLIALITAKTCGQCVSGPRTAPTVNGSYVQTISRVVHSTRSAAPRTPAGGTPTTDRTSDGHGSSTNCRYRTDGSDLVCQVSRPVRRSGTAVRSIDASSTQLTQLAPSRSPVATKGPNCERIPLDRSSGSPRPAASG